MDGDYKDPATFAGPAQGTGLGPAPGPLPRHPARAVRRGRGAARQVGLRQRRPRHRREAVRPGPGLGAGPQPHPAGQLRRVGDLPHRPLPGQEPGAEPALLPLRQLLPGADLEPQPRRERADHHGREFRRAGPRCSSTRRPAPSATWCRITCCKSSPTWRWSRRPGSTASRSATRRSRCSRKSRRSSPDSVVRGQFVGYRQEKGVAPDSKVETFAALRLEINSWRWHGVPFYIRAGKELPVTCTEVLVQFRRPPAVYSPTPPPPNYLRFRISPDVADRPGRDGQGARRGDGGHGDRTAGVSITPARTRWTPTSGSSATP